MKQKFVNRRKKNTKESWTEIKRKAVAMELVWCCCLVAQSCLTLCEPIDYSPSGSSGAWILQAILEWAAMSSCRRSSQPRDWTQVSWITGRFFTIWATRAAWVCLGYHNDISLVIFIGIYFSQLQKFGSPRSSAGRSSFWWVLSSWLVDSHLLAMSSPGLSLPLLLSTPVDLIRTSALWSHLTIITSEKTHLQISPHWAVQLQHLHSLRTQVSPMQSWSEMPFLHFCLISPIAVPLCCVSSP